MVPICAVLRCVVEDKRFPHISLTTFRLFIVSSQHVTPGARDLISKLIRKKPSDRLPLERVPQHPWIIRNTS